MKFGQDIGIPGFEQGPAKGAWLEVTLLPNATLHVRAAGLPGNRDLELGWYDGNEFRRADKLHSNERGRVDVKLKRPADLPEGFTTRFVLRTSDDKLRLASDRISGH